MDTLKDFLGGLPFGFALLVAVFWFPCALSGHGLAEHPVLGGWFFQTEEANSLPPTFEFHAEEACVEQTGTRHSSSR